MKYKAVIFDLDGVLVTTDDCHYRAWRELADSENIYFDREINERLRGISRMESLEILLERSEKKYSDIEKQQLADRKNTQYCKLIQSLSQSDILPGARKVVMSLKEQGIKVAIGSSSKNTKAILENVGLISEFEIIVDGNDITHSKPDPEVFILAAKKLGVANTDCLVIEDAEAGVAAAIRSGMEVIGVGSASDCIFATYHATSLEDSCVMEVFK